MQSNVFSLYIISFSVIYFFGVLRWLLAMETSLCGPLQIPLFIPKLDPLGLRGRLLGCVDVFVCARVCVFGRWRRRSEERLVMNSG